MYGDMGCASSPPWFHVVVCYSELREVVLARRMRRAVGLLNSEVVHAQVKPTSIGHVYEIDKCTTFMFL
jgi:hypothetical protein